MRQGMTMEEVGANVRELATQFGRDWRERQLRRALDPADFDQLRDAGFLLTAVPADHGGVWESSARSLRPIAEMLRALAHADPSLALVASMHPAVLSDWRSWPEAPPPYSAAWQEQRRWVFSTAREGAWWGTIVSEPGSGGDTSKTRATARRDGAPLRYRLTGQKHFGSGSGITSYVITTAVPEGESDPDRFFADVRGVPWDGSQGLTLVAAWDGQGMTATQSHAMRFDDFPATRTAWPWSQRPASAVGFGLGATTWTGIVTGIVETAVGYARRRLAPRRSTLRPYEQVEWARIEMEAWLIEQAYEGMLRGFEVGQGAGYTARLAKIAVAELAESALTRVCKVVGGGAYSRSTPYGFWLQDVRALGFLRPPYPLAYDQIVGGAWSAVDEDL